MPTMLFRLHKLQLNWIIHSMSAPRGSALESARSYYEKGNRVYGQSARTVFSIEQGNPLFWRIAERIYTEYGGAWPDSSKLWKLIGELIKDAELTSIIETRGTKTENWRQLDAFSSNDLTDIKLMLRRLRSFSRSGLSYDEIRLLRRAILRLFGYGSPKDHICLNCNQHSAQYYHIIECLGINLDCTLREGKWSLAYKMLRRAIDKCAPAKFFPSQPLLSARRITKSRPAVPDDWGGGEGGTDRNVRRRLQ